MLLVVAARAQPPLGRQRLDTRDVAVELGREEARAPHLAVRGDVDARLLLVAQRRVHGVVLDLADVHGPQLAPVGGGHGQVEPARSGMRPDDRRRHRRRLEHWCARHVVTSPFRW